MSADTTEQNAGGGDELRARYLPVSRKELRRRREAELAVQRAAEEESQATQDALAEAAPEPADEVAVRALQDTDSAEGDDLPEPPEPAEVTGLDEPGGDSEEADDAAQQDSEDSEPQTESDQNAPEIPVEAPVAVLPGPPRPAEEPARPEEEVADAESEIGDNDDVTQVISQVKELHEEPEEAAVEQEDLPGSRRARRLLRETRSIPPLSPELLAELDATNAEVAKNDDPNRVDPDLLKKQQALAAKAMQANQERMRKEHAEKEKERRRKLRERPESQVLTERMVRDSLNQDPEQMQYATGQIEPVHAQGAHGLDLNKMIDATSRQTDRQNVLVWLVVILAILLVGAIAAVVYFMVL
ncbi:hypothetical protein [Nesterenkonia ebinurensis]|uniref:hypothetical protein n=1 Tax=Nesterenkonia ebinurensis TaxID=2608252 RepID=UPI00123C850D|nr:hypothetical protein [Nesterenkonia ebinurensis]